MPSRRRTSSSARTIRGAAIIRELTAQRRLRRSGCGSSHLIAIGLRWPEESPGALTRSSLRGRRFDGDRRWRVEDRTGNDAEQPLVGETFAPATDPEQTLAKLAEGPSTGLVTTAIASAQARDHL